MTTKRGNGVPAAAGYRQYQESLIRPEFSDRIIRQVYCRSVTMDITTSDYTEGLAGSGATIGFQVEPAIDVHEYQKNQTLVPQELESEWRWLEVDRAKYFNVKIDRIDRKQIPNFDKLRANFCTNASKRMYTQLDEEVLFKMAARADKRNKGTTAGRDGDINLGQYGAPININATNLIDTMSCMQIVLEQACRWDEGSMFIVFPVAAKKTFFGSPLNSYLFTGENSITLNGRVRKQYMGFNIIFSNYVPRVFDTVTNRFVYYIIFGHKDSTGFVQQIDECDVMKIERSFGDYYRGLWVYGHGNMIPEAVGVAYAYFT